MTIAIRYRLSLRIDVTEMNKIPNLGLCACVCHIYAFVKRGYLLH